MEEEEPQEDLEEELEEELEVGHEEGTEQDPEEDPAKEGVEFRKDDNFKEEPEDLKVESGELVTKGNEHRVRVASCKWERCGKICIDERLLDALGSRL